MPRPPRPDDLYRVRVATQPRLSPDGRLAVFTLQTVAPGFDGYREALWLVATDGGTSPRQLTLGARHDRHPRFSPNGRTLAFLSDRRTLIEEEPDRPNSGTQTSDREDTKQVHLLPLDGGEARRLTDLPRGVDAFEWSPDGSRLVVISASIGATMAEDARRRGKAAQAEALFTVLRSLHRPVRLLRVPDETHELTRSGTPFRRVDNLRVVVDWFRHFLVDGKRGLPPLPRVRGGR